jgi:hypothetical protein
MARIVVKESASRMSGGLPKVEASCTARGQHELYMGRRLVQAARKSPRGFLRIAAAAN